MSPARSSTLRCREMAGRLTANGSAGAVTRAAPPARPGEDRATDRIGEGGEGAVELIGLHLTSRLINTIIKHDGGPDVKRRSAGVSGTSAPWAAEVDAETIPVPHHRSEGFRVTPSSRAADPSLAPARRGRRWRRPRARRRPGGGPPPPPPLLPPRA